MRFVGVIPARFQSTRFPGKPLVEICGHPLVEWVWRSTREATLLDEILVATDDETIAQTVNSFGGRVVMTRADHQSGTDRVAEVAAGVDADAFVNIQGDEPLIAAETIDAVCRAFLDFPEIEVSTARVRIPDRAQAESPHVTKVVVDRRGRALYFSRSLVPYPRRPGALFYKHLGIYGYRREFLLNLASLQTSALEEAEGLEQLRFLENGINIQTVEVQDDSVGVDVPEDVDRVRQLMENRRKLV